MRHSHVVQKKHTVFIVTYGLATLFLPTVYFYDIFTYTPGQEPSLPEYVTQTVPHAHIDSPPPPSARAPAARSQSTAVG